MNFNLNWTQLIFSYDQSLGGALFQNGKLVDASPAKGAILSSSYSTNLNIGRMETYNLFRFHGSIDDVRIYDRALSAEEIQLLYEAEAELPNSP